MYLIETKVTDVGLAPLKDLRSLQTLSLYQTAVTDAGLAKISTRYEVLATPVKVPARKAPLGVVETDRVGAAWA